MIAVGHLGVFFLQPEAAHADKGGEAATAQATAVRPPTEAAPTLPPTQAQESRGRCPSGRGRFIQQQNHDRKKGFLLLSEGGAS